MDDGKDYQPPVEPVKEEPVKKGKKRKKKAGARGDQPLSIGYRERPVRDPSAEGKADGEAEPQPAVEPAEAEEPAKKKSNLDGKGVGEDSGCWD